VGNDGILYEFSFLFLVTPCKEFKKIEEPLCLFAYNCVIEWIRFGRDVRHVSNVGMRHQVSFNYRPSISGISFLDVVSHGNATREKTSRKRVLKHADVHGINNPRNTRLSSAEREKGNRC
jgi:hypothetical protein